LFWVSVGASLGVLAVRKLQQTVEVIRPSSVAETLRSGMAEVASAIREFGDEVKIGMLERESELRYALGLDEDGVATKPQ
jgi:hypothetical protein